jgi:hypothetical protein
MYDGGHEGVVESEDRLRGADLHGAESVGKLSQIRKWRRVLRSAPQRTVRRGA